MRRVALTGLLLALAYAVMFAVGAGAASAAPVPTWQTTCAAGDVNENLCNVEAERLDYIAAELSAIDDNTTSTAAGASSVALSPDDSNRLDATWQGVWALVGLTLVLMVAPLWSRAWRTLRE